MTSTRGGPATNGRVTVGLGQWINSPVGAKRVRSSVRLTIEGREERCEVEEGEEQREWQREDHRRKEEEGEG